MRESVIFVWKPSISIEPPYWVALLSVKLELLIRVSLPVILTAPPKPVNSGPPSVAVAELLMKLESNI